MTIPENYPNHPPSVTFLTEMFHPLVDTQGNLSLSQQFATWRPYQDYLFHVLHYIKNIFKRVVLDGLVDKHCPHKEAYRLYVQEEGWQGGLKMIIQGQHASTWHRYRTDRTVFGKLAQQSAQLSITESYLFDHFPENNLIKFSKLSEAEYGKKRYLIDTIQHHDSLIYIQSL